jgi:purine-nucleoside phosphorylase
VGERSVGFQGFRDQDRILHTQEDVERAAEAIRGRIAAAKGPVRPEASPRAALVLGSGLGDYVQGLDDPISIPFAEIPGFPSSSVTGHPGRLVFGRRAGIPVIVQAGRYHLYEGLGAAEVAFPVRVFHALGVRVLVVTNAAGGVAPHLRPGDLLLLEDHIHLQFRNPLRGRGPLVDRTRFVDLARPYAPRLVEAARSAALAARIPRVLTGTYWSTLGPSYETPAEVRMIRRLGGDAVGMSTVNEVLVARQLGLEVLGIACIANLAAGLGSSRLSHEDVLRTVADAAGRMGRLLDATLPVLAGPFSAP